MWRVVGGKEEVDEWLVVEGGVCGLGRCHYSWIVKTERLSAVVQCFLPHVWWEGMEPGYHILIMGHDQSFSQVS